MRLNRRHTYTHTLTIDITSMIDVVFLLIIFFMVTAQFARDTRAELDLPQARGEEKEIAEEEGLLINIMRGGEIIVNSQSVTLDGLEQLVLARIGDGSGLTPAQATRVTLRADRWANAGQLNRVLERLRELRVGVASLATEVPR